MLFFLKGEEWALDLYAPSDASAIGSAGKGPELGKLALLSY